jgi:hypothetical protein
MQSFAIAEISDITWPVRICLNFSISFVAQPQSSPVKKLNLFAYKIKPAFAGFILYNLIPQITLIWFLYRERACAQQDQIS